MVSWTEIEDQHAELLSVRTLMTLLPPEVGIVSDDGLHVNKLDAEALTKALTGGPNTGND